MIQYAALLVVFSDSAGYWMPRRSLSSGAHSRDPLAGHDDSRSWHD
jgi:hypothetical protein